MLLHGCPTATGSYYYCYYYYYYYYYYCYYCYLRYSTSVVVSLFIYDSRSIHVPSRISVFTITGHPLIPYKLVLK